MNIEHIRHCLSALLINTDENHPLECDIVIGEGKAQGLSTLEMPHIISMFQLPSEGIIYFNIEGSKEPIEFDSLSKNDLLNIYNNFYDQKMIVV